MLSASKKNIIVFGDILLDIKLSGPIKRMANEAPIPILSLEEDKKYIGGCGNVLMNLQSLGCEKLFIVSKIGNDSYGREITSILSRYPEIVQQIYVDNAYKTVVKTRGFSEKKMIFRFDQDNKIPTLATHIDDIKLKIRRIILENRIDAIIFSDYNMGFIVKELSQYVIHLANEAGIPTFVDTRADYTKYYGCTVIKPNRKEVTDVFGIPFTSLETVHQTLKKVVGCKESLITLSEDGMSFSTADNMLINEKAYECDVNDVTGAGDVVLSILCYFYSFPKRSLIQLATYMGTISVQYVGTYVLKKSDILKAYKLINNSKLIAAEDVKHLKVPIIFTNGCFDILHEGHLSLLQFCKSIRPHEGQLVVAINSDASVKRLKGAQRPINDERARVMMLNNIESVDWIVVFGEDTPYETLEHIRPHTLVKGSDYTVESLNGREFCENVRLFDIVQGKSTTNIIGTIRSSR
jgi:D-beta-D-heptose 7-phosphate kinase/D-beta-D-heptose 1-phosphate adenosyltransferase